MIVKWTSFTDGVRQGYFNCLLALKNMYERYDGRFSKKELLLGLNAILKDTDTFIEYGDACCVYYTEFDKKHKPTKAKLLRPDVSYNQVKRSEAQKILLDMLEKGFKEQESDAK